MDDREILELYDRETRIGCGSPHPEARLEKHEDWVRYSRPGCTASDNSVIYSRLNAANADATIAGQIEFYRSIGSGFEWKHYQHDSPSDLDTRLLAHGFQKGDSESLMALELSQLPAEPRRPEHLAITRIQDPALLKDVFQVHEQVWQGDSSWLRQMLSEEMADPKSGTSVYMAYVGPKPVCSGWMRYTPGASFASLWGGSTLPEHRHQGIYRAMVLTRGRDALEKGARFITVDALPTSRPILQKIGFHKLTETTPYIWDPTP